MSDPWVRAAQPSGGRRTDYQDCRETSLWMRVLPPSKSGKRSTVLRTFYFRGSARGSGLWIRIGAYPQTSLARARAEAAQHRARFQADPDWREKATAAEAAAASQRLTVNDVIADFLANERGRVREMGLPTVPGRLLDASTVKWHAHVLAKHVAPNLGERAIKDLTTRDVRKVIEALGAAGKQKTANAVRQITSRLFDHARSRLEIEIANPASLVERYAEQPRSRCPSDEDVRAIHDALCNESQPTSRAVALALRVAMRTGQRIGEVVGAHESEMELDSAVWFVPAVRTKSGRPHKVPLVPQVVNLLKEAKEQRQSNHGGFVFASPQKPETPITRLACSLAMSRLCRRIGIEPVCPHDFRRLVRSLLGREWLDVNPMCAELVLSHSVGSRLQQIYDKHDYLRERRRALLALNAELDRIFDKRPIPMDLDAVELKRSAHW